MLENEYWMRLYPLYPNTYGRSLISSVKGETIKLRAKRIVGVAGKKKRKCERTGGPTNEKKKKKKGNEGGKLRRMPHIRRPNEFHSRPVPLTSGNQRNCLCRVLKQ